MLFVFENLYTKKKGDKAQRYEFMGMNEIWGRKGFDFWAILIVRFTLFNDFSEEF